MNDNTTDWNKGGKMAERYLNERERLVEELMTLQGTTRYTAELIWDWHNRIILADRKRIVDLIKNTVCKRFTDKTISSIQLHVLLFDIEETIRNAGVL